MSNPERRYSVRFDDRLWEDDLAASTPPARAVARSARARLESHGIPANRLLLCDDHEGSALAGMFKIRIPLDDPVGTWGIVLRPFRGKNELYFAFVAFGVRHPPADSSRWTVYQRAHNRLTR